MTHDALQSILLVEDNPGDARIIQNALEGQLSGQWKVVCVERLSEAIAQLTTHDYAAMLLDLSLPDRDGFESIKRVQSEASQVPIIVLTGLDDEEFAVKAVQEGAQDYLVKGQIVSSAIIRTVRYAIERHRLRQALHASE